MLSTCEQKAISPPKISAIVKDFASLFDEPKGLPPRRMYDHSIPLLPGDQSFGLSPYTFKPKKKNEIEAQIKKMLQNGIIQRSSSPFASPVLQVKKKDGE